MTLDWVVLRRSPDSLIEIELRTPSFRVASLFARKLRKDQPDWEVFVRRGIVTPVEEGPNRPAHVAIRPRSEKCNPTG